MFEPGPVSFFVDDFVKELHRNKLFQDVTGTVADAKWGRRELNKPCITTKCWLGSACAVAWNKDIREQESRPAVLLKRMLS